MHSNKTKDNIKYPRRPIIRYLFKLLDYLVLGTITDLHISGLENVPKNGPLLIVANHFSYIDPVAMVRVAPWYLEFLGGFNNPSAPGIVRIIPKLWGFYPLFRGTGSRDSLKAAEHVLGQGGIIGIFPEGGNWATVLRPARPGTAYLAVKTAAPILPMAFTGLNDIFPALRKGKRARVNINIGKVCGPFSATGRGRERREQLDHIGFEIMNEIARLLPQEKRGHFADDPEIRAAAAGTEIYPWAEKTEHELKTGDLM